jgi:hypothetical protein
VVSAGAGGSGYSVSRIRTGNPAAGLFRIVFDLAGPGSAPDVQLGRGSDGNLYLESSGIQVDPATAAAFPGVGPITAIAPTGAAGTSLRLSTTQAPQYSMYYLSGPARLVIDLK